jgi:hypothetical protein
MDSKLSSEEWRAPLSVNLEGVSLGKEQVGSLLKESQKGITEWTVDS